MGLLVASDHYSPDDFIGLQCINTISTDASQVRNGGRKFTEESPAEGPHDRIL
jgi:hypothetical protein